MNDTLLLNLDSLPRGPKVTSRLSKLTTVLCAALVATPILFFSPLFWFVDGGRYHDLLLDNPIKQRTVLNVGGLGWPYWEGANCLVDFHANFEPMGKVGETDVVRYVRRTSWRNFKQCPTGTLVYMRPGVVEHWRAEHQKAQQLEEERQQAEAVQNALHAQQLRDLTDKAKVRSKETP